MRQLKYRDTVQTHGVSRTPFFYRKQRHKNKQVWRPGAEMAADSEQRIRLLEERRERVPELGGGALALQLGLHLRSDLPLLSLPVIYLPIYLSIYLPIYACIYIYIYIYMYIERERDLARPAPVTRNWSFNPLQHSWRV